MTKIWLLDFDGVINAVSKRGDQNVWDDWKATRINGFNILYSPTVIDTIRQIHHETDVEIKWLSTWCEDTLLFQDHIPGLPILQWLDSTEVDKDDFKRHWKLNAAQSYVPDDADVMWTEDEVYLTNREAHDWMLSRSGPLTIINPAEYHGLLPRDLRLIREWAGL